MIFNPVVAGGGNNVETVQIFSDGTGSTPTISFFNKNLEFESAAFSMGKTFEVVKNSIFYFTMSTGSVTPSNSVHRVDGNAFYAEEDGTVYVTERS